MPYYINPDLSYCLVDGHPIFLDLEGDRYFHLSRKMEQVFLAHVEKRLIPDADQEELLLHGILVNADNGPGWPAPAFVQPPSESVVEQASHGGPAKIAAILDVLGVVYSTRLQLRRHCLKDSVAAMAAYRRDRTKGPVHLSPTLLEQLCEAATDFRHVRPYVPVTTSCLPDSLALAKFLAKRGLFAHLVFGVMTNPLSAHCWVQAGHLVLNDTVGNACAHTPIRVV